MKINDNVIKVCGRLTVSILREDSTEECIFYKDNAIVSGLGFTFADVFSRDSDDIIEKFQIDKFKIGVGASKTNTSKSSLQDLYDPISTEYGSVDKYTIYDQELYNGKIFSQYFGKIPQTNIRRTGDTSVTYTIVLDNSMCNNITRNGKPAPINEIGLFIKNPFDNNASILAAHRTFSDVIKTSDFSLIFKWTINFVSTVNEFTADGITIDPGSFNYNPNLLLTEEPDPEDPDPDDQDPDDPGNPGVDTPGAWKGQHVFDFQPSIKDQGIYASITTMNWNAIPETDVIGTDVSSGGDPSYNNTPGQGMGYNAWKNNAFKNLVYNYTSQGLENPPYTDASAFPDADPSTCHNYYEHMNTTDVCSVRNIWSFLRPLNGIYSCTLRNQESIDRFDLDTSILKNKAGKNYGIDNMALRVGGTHYSTRVQPLGSNLIKEGPEIMYHAFKNQLNFCESNNILSSITVLYEPAFIIKYYSSDLANADGTPNYTLMTEKLKEELVWLTNRLKNSPSAFKINDRLVFTFFVAAGLKGTPFRDPQTGETIDDVAADLRNFFDEVREEANHDFYTVLQAKNINLLKAYDANSMIPLTQSYGQYIKPDTSLDFSSAQAVYNFYTQDQGIQNRIKTHKELINQGYVNRALGLTITPGYTDIGRQWGAKIFREVPRLPTTIEAQFSALDNYKNSTITVDGVEYNTEFDFLRLLSWDDDVEGHVFRPCVSGESSNVYGGYNIGPGGTWALDTLDKEYKSYKGEAYDPNSTNPSSLFLNYGVVRTCPGHKFDLSTHVSTPFSFMFLNNDLGIPEDDVIGVTPSAGGDKKFPKATGPGKDNGYGLWRHPRYEDVVYDYTSTGGTNSPFTDASAFSGADPSICYDYYSEMGVPDVCSVRNIWSFLRPHNGIYSTSLRTQESKDRFGLTTKLLKSSPGKNYGFDAFICRIYRTMYSSRLISDENALETVPELNYQSFKNQVQYCEDNNLDNCILPQFESLSLYNSPGYAYKDNDQAIQLEKVNNAIKGEMVWAIDLLKNSPAAFRVNGRLVLGMYTNNLPTYGPFRTPQSGESWDDVILDLNNFFNEVRQSTGEDFYIFTMQGNAYLLGAYDAMVKVCSPDTFKDYIDGTTSSLDFTNPTAYYEAVINDSTLLDIFTKLETGSYPGRMAGLTIIPGFTDIVRGWGDLNASSREIPRQPETIEAQFSAMSYLSSIGKHFNFCAKALSWGAVPEGHCYWPTVSGPLPTTFGAYNIGPSGTWALDTFDEQFKTYKGEAYDPATTSPSASFLNYGVVRTCPEDPFTVESDIDNLLISLTTTGLPFAFLNINDDFTVNDSTGIIDYKTTLENDLHLLDVTYTPNDVFKKHAVTRSSAFTYTYPVTGDQAKLKGPTVEYFLTTHLDQKDVFPMVEVDVLINNGNLDNVFTDPDNPTSTDPYPYPDLSPNDGTPDALPLIPNMYNCDSFTIVLPSGYVPVPKCSTQHITPATGYPNAYNIKFLGRNKLFQGGLVNLHFFIIPASYLAGSAYQTLIDNYFEEYLPEVSSANWFPFNLNFSGNTANYSAADSWQSDYETNLASTYDNWAPFGRDKNGNKFVAPNSSGIITQNFYTKLEGSGVFDSNSEKLASTVLRDRGDAGGGQGMSHETGSEYIPLPKRKLYDFYLSVSQYILHRPARGFFNFSGIPATLDQINHELSTKTLYNEDGCFTNGCNGSNNIFRSFQAGVFHMFPSTGKVYNPYGFDALPDPDKDLGLDPGNPDLLSLYNSFQSNQFAPILGAFGNVAITHLGRYYSLFSLIIQIFNDPLAKSVIKWMASAARLDSKTQDPLDATGANSAGLAGYITGSTGSYSDLYRPHAWAATVNALDYYYNNNADSSAYVERYVSACEGFQQASNPDFGGDGEALGGFICWKQLSNNDVQNAQGAVAQKLGVPITTLDYSSAATVFQEILLFEGLVMASAVGIPVSGQTFSAFANYIYNMIPSGDNYAPYRVCPSSYESSGYLSGSLVPNEPLFVKIGDSSVPSYYPGYLAMMYYCSSVPSSIKQKTFEAFYYGKGYTAFCDSQYAGSWVSGDPLGTGESTTSLLAFLNGVPRQILNKKGKEGDYGVEGAGGQDDDKKPTRQHKNVFLRALAEDPTFPY